ncbi:hypothetical protein [Serratia sp. D1N4]
MKVQLYIITLLFISFTCLADSIKIVKTCKLKQGEKIQLIAVNTIDGDTLYLKFRNILVGAFQEQGEDDYFSVGDMVLSKCVNHSLIFALNFGPPYLKGCLVTAWNSDNKPESFCFAEKDLPESIWVSDKNTLIVIKNENEISALDGKYTIYDSARKSGERSYHIDTLPPKEGYKIFSLK